MRPVRRAMRRALRHPNPAALDAVMRANQLLANNQPAQAAQIFERLADEAARRGFAKPAANASAQAALAYAAAKNETAALGHARAALNQFARLGMTQRATNFLGEISQALRANGMARAAEALQNEFGGEVALGAPQASAPTGRLPSKCPHCAGPARSDQVEWIDAYSAECVYCGGVIQTEEE
jgi:hypothetical protein